MPLIESIDAFPRHFGGGHWARRWEPCSVRRNRKFGVPRSVICAHVRVLAGVTSPALLQFPGLQNYKSFTRKPNSVLELESLDPWMTISLNKQRKDNKLTED